MGGSTSKTERKSQQTVVKENCFQFVEDLNFSPQRKTAGELRENTPSVGQAKEIGSLRSSRRYYAHSIARTKLGAELERHGSDASLLPRIFSSSFKKKRSPVEKIDTRRAKRKGGVKKTQKNSMRLSNRLKGLTKEQLTDVILQAAQSSPNFEQKLHEICPQPDLLTLKKTLENLLDRIYKSFPSCHIGSTRDDFCYQRAAWHLHAFKASCLDPCETFFKAGLWSSLLDYVLMAWPIINRLPEWNNDHHNHEKRLMLKNISLRMKAALKNAELTSSECITLKYRIEEALKLDRSIEVVLDEVNKMISCF